jgi:hypothetical protein
VTGLRYPRHLKAMALVERDVLGVGGVEVGRQVVLVDKVEARSHQAGSKALSLLGAVDDFRVDIERANHGDDLVLVVSLAFLIFLDPLRGGGG